MALHIRWFLSFVLVWVLILATACGQQPPQVSDPSLPDVSDVSEQTSSSNYPTEVTTTTTEVTTTTAESTTTATTVDTTAKVTTTTSATTTATTTVTTTSTAVTTAPTTAPTQTTTASTTDTTTVTTTVRTTTTTAAPTHAPDAHPGEEWELFWSDEFNGTTLDESIWTVETGARNDCIQKRENVEVKDGHCYLWVKREEGKYAYSSGSMNSASKFSFQYGRLEFRAKLPYGQGVWPAFWTMGNSYIGAGDERGWPSCGEIDIMELRGAGNEAEKYNLTSNHMIFGTIHWGENRSVHKEVSKWKIIFTGFPADYYHIYAIEWDETSITWYLDDVAYQTISLDDPTMGNAFKQPHWLIVGTGASGASENSPLPQSLCVDYVRVYKKK